MRNKSQTLRATIFLVLVGGLLILISGTLAILGTPTGFAFMEGHLMIQAIQGISIYHGIIEALSGLILIVAAVYINSGSTAGMQNWLIAALVFSIISLIGGGGFFIGFILALIGGILGIINGYAPPGRYAYPMSPKESRIRSKHSIKIGPTRFLNTLKTEERKLYTLTEEAGGAIFQADLVDKSNFSKVKVSRLLDKLEGKGLIERKRRGMTNMVVIRKDTNPS